MSFELRVRVQTCDGKPVQGVVVVAELDDRSRSWKGTTGVDGYIADRSDDNYDGQTLRCEVTEPPFARIRMDPPEPVVTPIRNGAADGTIYLKQIVPGWRIWIDRLVKRIWVTALLKGTGFEEILRDDEYGASQGWFVLVLSCLAFGWCVSHMIAPLTGLEGRANLAIGMIGIALGMATWIAASFAIGRRLHMIDAGAFPRYLRTIGLGAAPLLVGVVGPFVPESWLQHARIALVIVVPWYVATTTLGVQHASNGPPHPLRVSSIAMALAAPLLIFAGMAVMNGAVVGR